MTIKEALAIKTSKLGISGGEMDLALVEAGLDGSSVYSPSTQAQAVDMVWAGLLLTTIQITELKEDDVSIKYSTDLKGIYGSIMRKWGLENPFAATEVRPTLKPVSNPWT